MFSECINLKAVNMEGLTIFEILQMEYMFYGCKNLERLNIKNINTEYLATLNYIFEGVVKKVKVEYNPNITCRRLENEIQKIILKE